MTPPPNEAITVLLDELGDLTRSGLLALLRMDSRFTVVGERAADAATVAQRLHPEPIEALTNLVESARRLQPDLIVLDPVSGETVDVNLIDELRAAAPSAHVVILTTVLEPDAVLDTLRRRVHGYFLPNFAAHGKWLLDTLALIARSSAVVLDPEIADHVWSFLDIAIPLHMLQMRDTEMPTLTDRERAVLRGMARGMTEKQIAMNEAISTRTVRRTIAELETKLGASTLSALATKAAQLGLTK